MNPLDLTAYFRSESLRLWPDTPLEANSRVLSAHYAVLLGKYSWEEICDATDVWLNRMSTSSPRSPQRLYYKQIEMWLAYYRENGPAPRVAA